MVGGLTDGLFATPYVRPLAQRLEQEQWSLVQTLLTSSHQARPRGCDAVVILVCMPKLVLMAQHNSVVTQAPGH